MPRYKFKEFLKEEGLEDSKHKSKLRTGWEGRDRTVDALDELISTLRELSLKNFERFEKERATVVQLEELIASNKIAVAKSVAIPPHLLGQADNPSKEETWEKFRDIEK